MSARLFCQDWLRRPFLLGVFLCLFQLLFYLEHALEPLPINLFIATVLNIPWIKKQVTYESRRGPYWFCCSDLRLLGWEGRFAWVHRWFSSCHGFSTEWWSGQITQLQSSFFIFMFRLRGMLLLFIKVKISRIFLFIYNRLLLSYYFFLFTI